MTVRLPLCGGLSSIPRDPCKQNSSRADRPTDGHSSAALISARSCRRRSSNFSFMLPNRRSTLESTPSTFASTVLRLASKVPSFASTVSNLASNLASNARMSPLIPSSCGAIRFWESSLICSVIRFSIAGCKGHVHETPGAVDIRKLHEQSRRSFSIRP
jgi:hypothetical protein